MYLTPSFLIYYIILNFSYAKTLANSPGEHLRLIMLSRSFLLIFILFFYCVFPKNHLPASSLVRVPVGNGYVEWELIGLDYMPLGWFIPLTGEKIPTIAPDYETEVYSYLLSHAPRFLVLEASVYPLPLAGIGVKKNYRDFYDSAEYRNYNLIESATSSIFEEPWAASVFFGNIVDFIPAERVRRSSFHSENSKQSQQGQKQEKKNENIFQGKGYSGFLISYGNYHIRRNELVRDDWVELEMKLLGSYSNQRNSADWSYRLGGKFHFNEQIKNYSYIGLKRDRTDFDQIHPTSLWRNSFFEIILSFLHEEQKLHRLQFLFGKKYPFEGSSVFPEVTLGVIWKFNSSYEGELALNDVNEVQFVFFPNIRF